jgi:hypothetical protein
MPPRAGCVILASPGKPPEGATLKAAVVHSLKEHTQTKCLLVSYDPQPLGFF